VAVRFFRSQHCASPVGHGSDFSEGNFGLTDLRLPWTAAGSEPGPGFIDGAGRESGADGPGAGLFEEELFEEKNDPLSPGPECSHLGIAYSAPARSAMTPSATRILSVTVLTPRVCVSSPDIFFRRERAQARALGDPGYFKSYPTKKCQATRRENH
jgi:hypothetical protein